MKDILQKKGTTIFLRLAVLTIGGIILAICIFALPAAWITVGDGEDWEYKDIAYAFHGILAGLYLAAIPFFYALYQSLKLLNYIDRNQAFSMRSVRALKRISYCAAVIAVIFIACDPFYYVWAQHDDAPGVVLFPLIIAGASLTIGTFAAVLQRLLKDAIKMKKENDLTV